MEGYVPLPLQKRHDDMKFFVFLLLTILLTGAAFAVGDASAQPPPAKTFPLVSLQGIVKQLSQPPPDTHAAPVHFRMDVGAKAAFVRLGPPDYLAKQGMIIKNGEQVSVTGWVVAEGPYRFLLVAREITAHGITVKLRRDDGRPLWPNPDNRTK